MRFISRIARRFSAATAVTASVLLLSAPAAAQLPPVTDYNDPELRARSDAEMIAGCDQFASHPLDPLKPSGVKGVRNDADIDVTSALLYCDGAFKADNKNPRIRFQWARVSQAQGGSVNHARHWYKLAYRDGSEIAGVYLAKLPPEKSWAELQAEVQRDMARIKGEQRQRPMTGTERDQMLIGSIITIGSVALLKILNGEAKWGSRECSGGFMLDANTHEVLRNGLVIGTY